MELFKLLTNLRLVISLLIFSACNSGKDPIMEINFKNLNHKELVEKLERKNLLSAFYNINEFYDTLYFFNINNDKDLKSVLWVNPEGYYFEKVNSLKINFGSDSVLYFGQMDYRPGKGLIGKNRLKKITDIYQKYHGMPKIHYAKSFDEIVFIDEVISKYKNSELIKEKRKKGKIDLSQSIKSDYILNYYDYQVWEFNEYKLMICTISPKADTSKVHGFIKYEVVDLDKIIAEKKEEIRKNADLNDYIEMELNLNPFTKSTREFYTDRLNIVSFRLSHVLEEEIRDIKQFKFNLFVENEYSDTILKVYDLELSLDYPLNAPSNSIYSVVTNQYQWTVDYNRNAYSSKEFEDLRMMRERKIETGRFKDIKLRYEITAIIFDDGDVLKR